MQANDAHWSSCRLKFLMPEMGAMPLLNHIEGPCTEAVGKSCDIFKHHKGSFSYQMNRVCLSKASKLAGEATFLHDVAVPGTLSGSQAALRGPSSQHM